MSSVRATYTECYRTIRILGNGGYAELPFITVWDPQVMPFTNALISYNSRWKSDEYKWRSWHRWRAWYEGSKPRFSDIPF
jgi:hypothetical protein